VRDLFTNIKILEIGILASFVVLCVSMKTVTSQILFNRRKIIRSVFWNLIGMFLIKWRKRWLLS
jgi:hypothetical protein